MIFLVVNSCGANSIIKKTETARAAVFFSLVFSNSVGEHKWKMHLRTPHLQLMCPSYSISFAEHGEHAWRKASLMMNV
jgi:hypothetical protein